MIRCLASLLVSVSLAILVLTVYTRVYYPGVLQEGQQCLSLAAGIVFLAIGVLLLVFENQLVPPKSKWPCMTPYKHCQSYTLTEVH